MEQKKKVATVFLLFLYSLALTYFYGSASIAVWINPPSALYSSILNLMTFLLLTSYVLLGILFERKVKIDFNKKIVIGIIASAVHFPGFIGIIEILNLLGISLNASYLFPMAVISVTIFGFPAGIMLSKYLRLYLGTRI